MKQIGLFLLLLVSISLGAQDKFHRNYPVSLDTSAMNLGGLYMSDGTYLMVSGLQSKEGDFKDLLFTNLMGKGDINWSFRYNIDTLEGARFDYSHIGLTQTQDSIYFMVNLNSESGATKLLGAISNSGVFGAGRKVNYGNIANEDGISAIKMTTINDSLIAHGSAYGAQSVPVIGVLDVKNGFHIAERAIQAPGDMPGFSDLTVDTSKQLAAITGEIEGKSGYYISVLNARTFLPIFGLKFKPTSGGPYSFEPKDIKILQDSSLVVAGRMFALNVNNLSDSFFGSFVAKHNSKGELLWAKYINVSDSFPVNISSVNEDAIALVLAGSYTKSEDLKAVPFMAAIDQNGNQLWTQEYSRTEGLRDFVGEAVKHPSGGHVFFTNVINDGTDTTVSLIRTDALGASSCEMPLVKDIFFNLPLIRDTLAILLVPSNNLVMERTVTDKPLFSNWDVPTLSLAVKNFCPNEPIIWTYHAKTPGAIKYEWSTGATTDSLTVFDTEEYTVIVTIDTNVCFTLCDTAKLGRYEEPMVVVGVEQGQFCVNGLMTAGIMYTPGAPIESIVWSNGQTTPFVQVGEGNISVVVTDICKEVATDTKPVVFPKLISSVAVTSDFAQFCTSGTGRLNAVADAQVTRYQWSNGASTSITGISSPGTYAVTVTDICLNTKTQSIVINQSNFPKLAQSVEVLQSTQDFCRTGNVQLLANVVGQFNTITWSNGQTGETIEVPGKAAGFEVVVRDDCKSISAQIQLEDVEPVCFKLPKLFFPDSNLSAEGDPNNRVFKAFAGNCGDLSGITGFEFHIFNRWGQEVFSTTNPNDGWDGRVDSNPAPPDSYVYYIKYKQADCDLDTKGDVTLVR